MVIITRMIPTHPNMTPTHDLPKTCTGPQLVVNLPPRDTTPAHDNGIMKAIEYMECRMMNVIKTEMHQMQIQLIERERQHYEEQLRLVDEKLQSRNEKLMQALQNKDNECEQLKSVTVELRSQINRLIVSLSQTNWQNYTSRTKTSDLGVLMMGSGIIRDIDEKKLANTRVVCLPEARISDITTEMKKQETINVYDKTHYWRGKRLLIEYKCA